MPSGSAAVSAARSSTACPGRCLRRRRAPCEAKVEVTATHGTAGQRPRHRELTIGGTDHGQAMLRFTATATGDELLAEQPAHFWWPGPRLFTPSRQRLPPAGAAVPRLRRTSAVRPRPAPARAARPEGHRPRPGAAQRRGDASRSCCRTAATACCGTARPSAGSSSPTTAPAGWPTAPARSTTGSPPGTPAEVLRRYADATGHVPELPEWASGFWQSKLRYRTQDELLGWPASTAAAACRCRSSWSTSSTGPHLGDWQFDPAEWPDPAADGRRAARHGRQADGVGLALGRPLSRELRRCCGTAGPADRHRVRARSPRPTGRTRASPRPCTSPSTTPPTRGPGSSSGARSGTTTCALRHRRVVARRLRAGAEARAIQANLRYHAGPGLEVGNMYPRENARTFSEGMAGRQDAADGQPDAAPRGRAASGTARRCGPATSPPLRHPARADPRRAERRDQRHPVVDHRHRRLPRRRPGSTRSTAS